jgi:hypothetical protein
MAEEASKEFGNTGNIQKAITNYFRLSVVEVAVISLQDFR